MHKADDLFEVAISDGVEGPFEALSRCQTPRKDTS